MQWSTVNHCSGLSQTNFQSEATVDEMPPQDFTSQHRVNILAAAERLVDRLPGIKRKASTSLQRDTKKLCSEGVDGKIQRGLRNSKASGSDKQKADQGRKVQTRTSPRSASKSPHHSRKLSSTCTNEGTGQESEDFKDQKTVQLVESSFSTPGSISVSLAAVHKGSSVKSCSAANNESLHQVIEISSDDSFEFEDFDESLFDGLSDPSASGSSTSPQSTIFSTTSSLKTDNSVGSNQPQYPNQAPYPPFLHPCPMESLRDDSLTSRKYNASNLSPACTCFRVAEVMRITGFLFSSLSSSAQDTMIELFATIREVRYANSLGHRQGLVLGDCFFPGKPPYITAISKNPFSARDLLTPKGKKEEPKKIVKALIRCTTNTPRPHHGKKTAKRQTGEYLDATAVNADFEVLDVQETSWEEVDKVRKSILRDFQARQEAMMLAECDVLMLPEPDNATKQLHCESSNNSSNLHDSDDYFDQLSDIIDFSDVEFDLPELGSIIGTYKAR